MKIPAYISAGGASRRFGSDKARAELLGEPLILRLYQKLQVVCGRVTVVADVEGKYADLNLTTIADAHPGCGPMSALEAAILHAEQDSWLLLVSCDWVDVRCEWIESLYHVVSPGIQAVAYKHEYWEPMLAIYHTSLLSEAQQRIASGHRSMQSLLNDVGAKSLGLPHDWPHVAQINTQQDLKRAEMTMMKKE